jgi:putative membrane protein
VGFSWVWALAVVALVLIGSTITYLFYRYRIVDDAVQVRRGALFKKHLNLTFARSQNINVEHPFYFRPFGLVTLKIDGAGSKGEEVNIAALSLEQARALREFIRRRKQLGAGASAQLATSGQSEPETSTAPDPDNEEPFYCRSVPDLILHGLTNNRSFIAVAAIFGFLVQSGRECNGKLLDEIADCPSGGLSATRDESQST